MKLRILLEATTLFIGLVYLSWFAIVGIAWLVESIKGKLDQLSWLAKWRQIWEAS